MASFDGRRLIPVVLSGGSGTRLWPLSRERSPKQFIPLFAGSSLFQQTLLRVRGLPGLAVESPIVIANEAHAALVLEQAHSVGVAPTVVLEPAGRNTAPAVTVAALLARRAAPNADPLLLILPADHVIADTDAFGAALAAGSAAAEAQRLVTFGVVPERPETGYGYIQRGDSHGAWATIRRFVEKPDLSTAESYLRTGEYLWNSGMFLFSAARVLAELAAHAAPVLSACGRALAEATTERGALRLGPAFLEAPAISIDYAVMEKTADGAVVPLSAGWSDVGSWTALHDVTSADARGNCAEGDVLLESCTNTYVKAATRVVAAVGLDDVVIVETADAVLVVRRDRAQDVKRIVDRLKAEGRGPR
jgi:mannose-1-phosphate guanylyltransferase/mannose-6-phosphate isomerase